MYVKMVIIYLRTNIKVSFRKSVRVFHCTPWCQKSPQFTGHIDLLKTVREMLCDETPKEYNHCVAFGMGGVGKTQVAIEYVVTHRANYQCSFQITAADLAGLL